MDTESEDANAVADSDSPDGSSIPRRFIERTVDDVIEGREPYDNRDTLFALYHIRGHTQKEIAEAYGVDQSAISRAMNRHGVPTRESNNTPTVDENDDGDTPSATAN
jgi:DNA-directed RNA polymerase specialized sigma24 family protein